MTLLIIQNGHGKIIITDEIEQPCILAGDGTSCFEIPLNSLSDFLVIEESIRKMRHEWTKKMFAPRS